MAAAKRPKLLPPPPDLWTLARRILTLLCERDGVQDVRHRLAACVLDLEQRKAAGEWSPVAEEVS